MVRFNTVAVAIGLAGPFVVTHAVAQKYPDKPVRMIVVSAPSGSTDILARGVAQSLTETTGQNFVVDNKPGAGGIIAAETLAHALPDGYTILLTNTSHSVLPSLHPKLPYDSVRDFAPVTLVAITHSLLVVNPAVPVKNVRELIELAKAQPGKVNYAAGTTGAAAHLGGELFKTMAGVNIIHVPYKGTAAQITALLGGEVQMSFVTMPAALPLVRSGRLRVLAVGSLKRASSLPDVPTVSESGLPGYDVAAWNGILAPAKTPPAIIAYLNGELVKMARNPQLKQRAEEQGSDLVMNTPQEFAAYLKAQATKWAAVVKASGMKADD